MSIVINTIKIRFLSPQNRKKENPDELDLEIFGHWQTEVYIPPPAVNVSLFTSIY